MKEQIKQIVEAAKDNEEAQAILAAFTPETTAEEGFAIIAKAAKVLGIDFNATQDLTEDELAAIGGGSGNIVDWGELFGNIAYIPNIVLHTDTAYIPNIHVSIDTDKAYIPNIVLNADPAQTSASIRGIAEV